MDVCLGNEWYKTNFFTENWSEEITIWSVEGSVWMQAEREEEEEVNRPADPPSSASLKTFHSSGNTFLHILHFLFCCGRGTVTVMSWSKPGLRHRCSVGWLWVISGQVWWQTRSLVCRWHLGKMFGFWRFSVFWILDKCLCSVLTCTCQINHCFHTPGHHRCAQMFRKARAYLAPKGHSSVLMETFLNKRFSFCEKLKSSHLSSSPFPVHALQSIHWGIRQGRCCYTYPTAPTPGAPLD